MAEATEKKVAPKRKPAAKKVAIKKTAARKPVAKKAAPKKAAKKTGKKAGKKAAPDFAARAQETGRKAFLASLGFYGKAFDQVQEQFSSMQDELEVRRKKADKLYAELVKRGEKVEKKAKKAVDEIELPKIELDSLTDRKKLDAQLDKAKARFDELRDELKDTMGLKKAA
jgi:FtsZ-binding cell division protein ZapB